ncbi:hypothetical protein PR048_030250 [Dryococelus australis]|uniref:Helitron helicase-like domain-containing protein n=1 Tax=Dryococelus australis TaxID=614101 RepID=A0ABQ9GCC9_9NEOP|nr:hypothetical protein PR048_030250 [Dryococelus australis]
MTYPVLFPHGEPGYTCGQQHTFIVGELRNSHNFSILHHSGKLFQQYVVDCYCKAEAIRLWYIGDNQANFRAEEYQGLLDHLEHQAADVHARVGKLVILPSSFYGSDRQIYQCYQDSIAIMRQFGKPDLFITFTCNPKWPEILLTLQGQQISCHRSDLV